MLGKKNPDGLPLARIDDLLNPLSEANYSDLHMEYGQMPLKETSKKKTTFAILQELLKFIKMIVLKRYFQTFRGSDFSEGSVA